MCYVSVYLVLRVRFLPERDYVTFGSLLSQFRLSSVASYNTLNVSLKEATVAHVAYNTADKLMQSKLTLDNVKLRDLSTFCIMHDFSIFRTGQSINRSIICICLVGAVHQGRSDAGISVQYPPKSVYRK